MNTANNNRLNIPGFVMADGPHGVRDGFATSFPVGIGVAAAWDTNLAFRLGVAMGKEFRAKGKNQALGPCLDLDRDPRNGRSPESGGEDPYLCARVTTAVVRGLQTQPVIATIKHYSANHRENGRTTNNIIASRRTLEEHNGLPFRMAVQQGGALSVMNAYNLINGEKCAENQILLTEILKEDWGFPYYVVSDWGSIWSVEKAAKAGCDIEMGSDLFRVTLPGLVANGTVPMSVIDKAVRNVLRTKLVSGVLGYLPPGTPADVNSAAHQQLCVEAARKSIVLLKNEQDLLPLNAGSIGTIALIGPSAAVCQIDGSGSSYVTPYRTVSPLDGLRNRLGDARVAYAKGCDINSGDTSGFDVARQLARTSDVVLFVGGLDPGQEGEGFDRVGSSIELPGKQQDLINILAGANRNLIAVIYSGGVCGLSKSIGNIRSLLYAFYPGQESGAALADVLLGDCNPAGRLPVTFPKNDAQLPAWNDDFTDDHGGGYRWFDRMSRVPQFAFGRGLSYTTFQYSGLVITPAVVQPGEPVTVRCTITNTGQRDGEEVAQLYLSDSLTTHSIASKQLRGFSRVQIPAGQSRDIAFTLAGDELYYFDEFSGAFDIEPGRYRVRVGGSSDNLSLSGDFEIAQGTVRPDLVIGTVRTIPAYPVLGDSVTFIVSVRNQGSAPTPEGLPLKVSFSVDNELISWSSETIPAIPPGGMAMVCGSSGPTGSGSWAASKTGSFAITALIDPENRVVETVESNNAGTGSCRVYPVPPANLAVNKSASATSSEGPALGPAMAVDGNMGTRWSSSFTDPQAFTVDLGGVYAVGDVTLYWEYAFGKEYSLMISDGISAWDEVFHEYAGDGGMDVIPVGKSARKIMLLGLKRGSPYGYSLYEFEVHTGISSSAITDQVKKMPGTLWLSDGYPNPFNPESRIDFTVGSQGSTTLEVFDLLGRRVAELWKGACVPGRTYTSTFGAWTMSSGLYLAVLQNGGARVTKKLTLIR